MEKRTPECVILIAFVGVAMKLVVLQRERRHPGKFLDHLDVAEMAAHDVLDELFHAHIVQTGNPLRLVVKLIVEMYRDVGHDGFPVRWLNLFDNIDVLPQCAGMLSIVCSASLSSR